MVDESRVVSFPVGKPAKAAAKNCASKSPNHHLEQLIALREEYRRKDSRLCGQTFALTTIGLENRRRARNRSPGALSCAKLGALCAGKG